MDLGAGALANARESARKVLDGIAFKRGARWSWDDDERMARAVEAAEAIAPTRPHPGVESPIANLALGPVVAVVDKARDAIRKVLG